MKKLLVCLLGMLCLGAAKAQELSYYLPDSVTYDPAIPTPEQVIGHKVGEWHVTHDRLVNYMKAVAAAAPGRIRLEVTGYTYETRPQLLLTITSAANHQNIEAIRQQHLQLGDPARSASLNTSNMPAVVWMGYSIHGNESSGSNAALLAIYYLAAARGPQIEDLLNHTVILLDPAFNPDGLNRFATWANMHKSQTLVTDPNSREFNEVWPGGRFNHYWFDLNRDWLPAVHVESRNRLQKFHEWRPNILTDHHEMGSNASFFFQPGVPSRVNPLTPAKNQQLTGEIGKFHARFLNRIGSLYFTKEGYDDFYYGKGSTFPDIHGGIGILFEQASSRGHAQQVGMGVLRFPFTIRNQFVTTLSTLEAARELRVDLLNYQRDFYEQQAAEARTAGGAYVFGSDGDPVRANQFIDIMLRQQVQVYELKSGLTADGNRFEPGQAWVVPANQQQHKLVRTLFDKQFQFKDSIFYDISSWTMPIAYGLPFANLGGAQYNAGMAGNRLTQSPAVTGTVVGGKSGYAYLFDWNQLYAPRALYQLQEAGLVTKVATNPFELTLPGGNRKFGYGTIVIPVAMQRQNADQLYDLVQRIAAANSVTLYNTATGNSLTGSDLGSAKMADLSKPSIAMLAGTGVNATDAGEVWFMLDQHMHIPATHLETAIFNRGNINRYNTLLMVSGNYDELNKEKLKAWVQGGGTLVLFEDAIQFAAQAGIANFTMKKAATVTDSNAVLSYVQREQIEGAQQMPGLIVRAALDITHPLGYGYTQPYIDIFKSNKVFPLKSKNPYATPGLYGDNPVTSGYISKANLANLKNTSAIQVQTVGSGRVIAITDNPNFRAYWLGGTKLLMNSIFFGRNIDAASARSEE